jgi:hypothetical protein
MYFVGPALEKIQRMTALYVVGIAAFWAILLVVVRRRGPEEA